MRSVNAVLKDICHLITDGKHGDCTNQEDSGYFFISAKDVRDWKINYDNARQITVEDFSDTHKRTQLELLDVVIVSTGANIGDIAIAKDLEKTAKTTFQKSVAILKPNQHIVNPIYLAYHLKGNREILQNISSGSAQKNLLLRDLRLLEIKLPCIALQNRIASILSAYDALIENNLRRIKLLEDAARCEYKMLMEGSLSEVPLKEVAVPIKRGISPKYVETDGITVINQKCIRALNVDFSQSRLTDKNKAISKERMLEKYDILVNSTGTGTLGRVSINLNTDFPCTVDSHVTIVRAVEESMSTFLAFSILSQQSIISMMGEGSTNQTELSPKRLGQEIMVPVVGEELIEDFHKSAVPKLDLIWNLSKQNTQLRQARDILLPKLMSGEIDVEEDISTSTIEMPVYERLAAEEKAPYLTHQQLQR